VIAADSKAPPFSPPSRRGADSSFFPYGELTGYLPSLTFKVPDVLSPVGGDIVDSPLAGVFSCLSPCSFLYGSAALSPPFPREDSPVWDHTLKVFFSSPILTARSFLLSFLRSLFNFFFVTHSLPEPSVEETFPLPPGKVVVVLSSPFDGTLRVEHHFFFFCPLANKRPIQRHETGR